MIGIDFGTTNTCAAIDGGLYEPVRAISLRPENTHPYDTVIASAVLDPLGQKPLLGRNAQQASRQRGRADKPFLNYFKPQLDQQRLKERRHVVVSTSLLYDPMNQGDRVVANYDWVEVGGAFSRAEIVKGLGVLLDFVLAQARDGGGTDELILLGTPVSFSSRARKRMLAALAETGRFSGYQDLLRRVRFVHEPVAAASAAMAEAADFDESENVLVFDHGGGTLDLSIVRFERRDGFDYPVPITELGAGGADDVAGRAIDHAFIAELRSDAAIGKAFAGRSDWEIQTFVEGTKIGLSTAFTAPLVMPNFAAEVERATFVLAMRTILARIEVEVEHVLDRAGLQTTEINRVVMTGGSSLIPCMQDVIKNRFGHLDEYRLRTYDPADPRDVEQAITEVAQGLVRHAQANTLEHVVHWDIELLTSEGPGFVTVAERGEPYGRDLDGRPELVKTWQVDDANRDGMAIGVYERKLDRDFVFGIADVPPQYGPVSLRISLRPDAVFPKLEVLDEKGELVHRAEARTGWAADRMVAADLDALPQGQLKSFFDSDVEYLPDARFSSFEHAPLARRLRKDDYIEWTEQRTGTLRANRGVIQRIMRRGDHEDLNEMTSWDLREFRFIVSTTPAQVQTIEPDYGYVRLAPRPPAA